VPKYTPWLMLELHSINRVRNILPFIMVCVIYLLLKLVPSCPLYVKKLYDASCTWMNIAEYFKTMAYYIKYGCTSTRTRDYHNACNIFQVTHFISRPTTHPGLYDNILWIRMWFT
jgi:hypothetical protein